MKAVGYRTSGPIDCADSLEDITLDAPVPTGRDLRVAVKAVSVNPVDVKVRAGVSAPDGQWKVLGFDASGVVDAVGPEVTAFKLGDEVYYAGVINRAGTNSELHLVDERIVGCKPKTLRHSEAAALPLTTLTAWEMLFDRLDVQRPTAAGGKVVLIIGGAGGVGSIAIQLLRALTDVTVIATASQSESQKWVRELGAHHVIDHRKLMAPQIEALGIGAPGFVFSTNQTAKHLSDIAELIAPQGRFGLIDLTDPFEVRMLARKSVSVHFELMFTRGLFTTPDMGEQSRLLSQVADLVDAGRIRSTLTEVAGKIDAATLRAVHRQIETGTARGKLVLEGF